MLFGPKVNYHCESVTLVSLTPDAAALAVAAATAAAYYPRLDLFKQFIYNNFSSLVSSIWLWCYLICALNRYDIAIMM